MLHLVYGPVQLVNSITHSGPYIWLPAEVVGTMSVASSPLDVELTFKDIFDNFSVFGVSGRGEAWKDNTWGIIFDGFYMTMDGDFGEPTTHTFNPTIAATFTGPTGLETIDILLAPEFDVTFDPNLNVDVRQAAVDMALGWRVCDKSISKTGEPWPHLTFDLIGGARYGYLKEEVTFTGKVTIDGPMGDVTERFRVVLGGSKDWLEPMIGGRIALQFNEKWGLGVRGDASGFGLGSASDLTANVLGGLSYSYSPRFYMVGGWRANWLDYERGSG